MFVPPIPLFAVHGKPEDRPSHWTRSRIICFDDDGIPLIVGNEAYKIEDKFCAGDKTLRRATEYSNYIGISEASDSENTKQTITASPGWKCLFGVVEGSECDFWIREVAAWKADTDCCLKPIVIDEQKYAHPIDLWGPEDSLVRIFEPGEEIPEEHQLKAMVSVALTKK